MQHDYEEQFITTNGITLHTIVAGPDDGPLVILLHGFPEFWYGWRHQIDALAAAGYRVLAPDQRGYNQSDKPRGIAAYNIDELAADAVGLIDAAGRESAVLVGHDWGAAVAWWAALRFPERLERVAILNVPHPIVMRRHLRNSLSQLAKSWYMFFFQTPWLPEWMLSRGDYSAGLRSLRGTSRRGTFSDEDLDQYRAAWSQPGALTGMINWYRALLRARPGRVDSIRVRMPLLMIWGVQDRFLGRELAQPSIELCDQGRVVFLDDATHWVQHEEPQRVNELLLEFLAEPTPATSSNSESSNGP